MTFKHADIEKALELEKSRSRVENRDHSGFHVYLVSLELPKDDPAEIQEGLVELGALVRTLSDECVGVLVQKKSKPDPATFIGQGKLEELKEAVQKLKVDYIVFDQDLSPTQVRNIENIISVPVLDRTGIILQIFKKNARTKEARTQVEIAHLEYHAPRLSNAWITWERQRGGGGSGGRLKGSGETQIETDRRRLKDKVAILKRDLEKIEKERDLLRKSRSEEWNVVLVGYTNAGKTTIMNGLTESQLSAKDSLFETLDSSIRILKGSNTTKILVTDTVGFIRNLPHALVASFKSTLEELVFADLILHVVDISHPSYKDHILVTEDILKQLGAFDVPRIIVFNKIDKLSDEPKLPKILSKIYPKSICISGSSELDIKKVRDAVITFIEQHMIDKKITVSCTDSKLLSIIHSKTRILDSVWEQETGTFNLRMSTAVWQKYFEDEFDQHSTTYQEKIS